MKKNRSSRNKTLTCTKAEIKTLSKQLVTLDTSKKIKVKDLVGRVINQDITELFKLPDVLPFKFIDLLIVDPPYNLTKQFGKTTWRAQRPQDYADWFYNVFFFLKKCLKDTATIYVCSNWGTSHVIEPILSELFYIQNRITWERGKGRGAKRNWKDNAEDIWFCTNKANKYYFDVDAVKLKRKVLAPYKSKDGQPKDWVAEETGNFRLTHPSNIWNDITIPFWSMAENTDHPTQKPEKLIAKLILASSKKGDFVFDPFLGSGTTAVVAQKLGRRFSGVELDLQYCCWALKRLEAAKKDKTIQGYAQGVFWERNSQQ